MNLTLENYRSIFDDVSDAIFVFDMNTGTIIEVNNAVSEMFGYTREEARKADIGTLSAGQYPHNYQGAMERIRRAIGGEQQLFEWLARDRSGRTFPVEVSLRRSAINGEDRIVAVVRDIAARRRTEQRLALQYTVARALTEAATLSEATPMILVHLRTRRMGPRGSFGQCADRDVQRPRQPDRRFHQAKKSRGGHEALRGRAGTEQR